MSVTVLRVAAGAIVFAFGVGKFLHHAREAASFAKYGLPDPSHFVYAIGVVEIGFGALLVLGLATRLAALSLAGNLVGAIATAGPVEGGAINLGLAPALLVAMLVLLWTGGGRWSVDGVLRPRLPTTFERAGPLVALVLRLALDERSLARRRPRPTFS
jgi:putative oxidoreductase